MLQGLASGTRCRNGFVREKSILLPYLQYQVCPLCFLLEPDNGRSTMYLLSSGTANVHEMQERLRPRDGDQRNNAVSTMCAKGRYGTTKLRCRWNEKMIILSVLFWNMLNETASDGEHIVFVFCGLLQVRVPHNVDLP